MKKSRLEAFSDGVLAIVITIMVLELKVPPYSPKFSDLSPLLPVFVSYILSFIYLAIYWNNHHHLFQLVEKVTAGIMWANMHLLFWLSLIPFVTGWMGENHFAPVPVALYGAVLLLSAIAYRMLVRAMIASHGRGSLVSEAIGGDFKGNASIFLYAIGIPSAFYSAWLAGGIYTAVAAIWLVPDKRVERVLEG